MDCAGDRRAWARRDSGHRRDGDRAGHHELQPLARDWLSKDRCSVTSGGVFQINLWLINSPNTARFLGYRLSGFGNAQVSPNSRNSAREVVSSAVEWAEKGTLPDGHDDYRKDPGAGERRGGNLARRSRRRRCRSLRLDRSQLLARLLARGAEGARSGEGRGGV